MLLDIGDAEGLGAHIGLADDTQDRRYFGLHTHKHGQTAANPSRHKEPSGWEKMERWKVAGDWNYMGWKGSKYDSAS
jgi:hypothetical protein